MRPGRSAVVFLSLFFLSLEVKVFRPSRFPNPRLSSFFLSRTFLLQVVDELPTHQVCFKARRTKVKKRRKHETPDVVIYNNQQTPRARAIEADKTSQASTNSRTLEWEPKKKKTEVMKRDPFPSPSSKTKLSQTLSSPNEQINPAASLLLPLLLIRTNIELLRVPRTPPRKDFPVFGGRSVRR